jgi:hypothetical protein
MRKGGKKSDIITGENLRERVLLVQDVESIHTIA